MPEIVKINLLEGLKEPSELIYPICAIEIDEQCLYLDEFIKHSNDASFVKHAQGMVKLFEKVATNPQGPRCLNDDQCHQIDKKNKIWQFTKGRLRVLWFYGDGKLIVCSHVFVKRTKKTPKAELNKAVNIKRIYES